MQITPSKNPEKESKQFALLSILMAVGSLFLWFIAIAGLAFAVRAVILGIQTKNNKYWIVSSLAGVLNFIVLCVHFVAN